MLEEYEESEWISMIWRYEDNDIDKDYIIITIGVSPL